MIKVCGPSIYKPLEIVFNQCLETGVFPSEWKKGNIVPTHKKETDIYCKVTVQCRCYLYVGKFLKDLIRVNQRDKPWTIFVITS